jgi:conjugative transfer region protein TrbK
MASRMITVMAIARAAGFVAVAMAIGAAALHSRQDNADASAPTRISSIETNPLILEIARCQAPGLKARDDAACGAVWAENRRRFFGFDPVAGGPTDSSPATGSERR